MMGENTTNTQQPLEVGAFCGSRMINRINDGRRVGVRWVGRWVGVTKGGYQGLGRVGAGPEISRQCSTTLWPLFLQPQPVSTRGRLLGSTHEYVCTQYDMMFSRDGQLVV